MYLFNDCRHVWNQMAEDVITSLRVQTIDVIKPYQQHFWYELHLLSLLFFFYTYILSSYIPLILGA